MTAKPNSAATHQIARAQQDSVAVTRARGILNPESVCCEAVSTRVLCLRICAAIANWWIVRDSCLKELIHSSRVITAVGGVAPGSAVRQSTERATDAFVLLRSFGWGCTAPRNLRV